MRTFLITLIKIYQKTLSPDHGWFRARWPHGYCRYHPTCSQYGIEAIQLNGSIRGSIQTAKRIARCNPFATPGVDPVPKL
jgi:putative membrane protein insertion efficiency factor